MTTDFTPNFGLALPDFRMGPWHDLLNGDITKIDQLLATALSSSNVIAWAHSTSYAGGISVLDETDATIWMCVVAHTSAATGTFAQDRSAHPTYWTRLLTGFAPRGEWANNTNYFPYDLAYQSHLGIFALCEQTHVSNPSGTIKDDSAYWAFLCDLSNSNLAAAVTVTYSNATSPTLPNTNVQAAIDKLEDFVVGLNSVNVTQGSDIATLRTDLNNAIATLNASITSLSNLTMKLAGNQTTTGGFRITPFNAGNSVANFIPNPMNGNYQYVSNVGAFTFQPPLNDCAMDVLIINSPTAGPVAFPGFSVGLNIGDIMTITNGHRFLISLRRINGIATYSIKALQ